MQKDHRIIKAVYGAKKDPRKADELIRSYIPFIRSEAAKCISRVCTEQDDEYSIALIAFHEAILGYERERGAFLGYASMLIKSRIIDYQRREARHQGQVSIYAESGEDDRTILDEMADGRDHYEEAVNLEATKQEIAELSAVMARFGVSFSDVADHSPRQERTLEACTRAVRWAAGDELLLEELLRTGKLPMARLVQGSGGNGKPWSATGNTYWPCS